MLIESALEVRPPRRCHATTLGACAVALALIASVLQYQTSTLLVEHNSFYTEFVNFRSSGQPFALCWRGDMDGASACMHRSVPPGRFVGLQISKNYPFTFFALDSRTLELLDVCSPTPTTLTCGVRDRAPASTLPRLDAAQRAAFEAAFLALGSEHAERSDADKRAFVLVSAASNLAYAPTAWAAWRRGMLFESWLITATLVFSFMYHLVDSVQAPVWLTERQWHKLDNTLSIQCMVAIFIHLAGVRDAATHLTLNFFSFGFVILLNEWRPWRVETMALPIGAAVALFLWAAASRTMCGARLCRCAHASCAVPFRLHAVFDRRYLVAGFVLLAAAVCCFVRGLREHTDPYRVFHGCWHACGGAAGFCFVRALPPPDGAPGGVYHWPSNSGSGDATDADAHALPDATATIMLLYAAAARDFEDGCAPSADDPCPGGGGDKDAM